MQGWSRSAPPCALLSVECGAERATATSEAPAVYWLMRKTTNSAGFTGEMPISTVTWPASMFSGGFVSASHLTKNASPGRAAEQRAVAPHAGQEVRDRDLQAHPEPLVVRLEHRPLRALDDRRADEVEQAPDVEVAPLGVARQRARAPDADAAARERADAVDADPVEAALLVVGDLEGQAVRADARPRWPGALCTPRVASVRHHTPATWPDGGIIIGWLVSGFMTSTHGQYSVANLES